LGRVHQRVPDPTLDDEPPVDGAVLGPALGVGEFPVGRVPAAVVHLLYADLPVLRTPHEAFLALPVGDGVALGRRRPGDEQLLPAGPGEPVARGTRRDVRAATGPVRVAVRVVLVLVGAGGVVPGTAARTSARAVRRTVGLGVAALVALVALRVGTGRRPGHRLVSAATLGSVGSLVASEGQREH